MHCYYRLVNETRQIMLVQAGTEANQFASANWSHRQHNIFYQKSHRQKFLFSQDSKDTCSLIFVSLTRKVKSLIEQNILLLLLITKTYMQDTCSIILQCFKSFQLQSFLFFYPSISFSELELLLMRGKYPRKGKWPLKELSILLYKKE